MKAIVAIAAVLASGVMLAPTARADAYCGYGVTAIGPTSCGFALNVAAAWQNSPGDQVGAYSPATGLTYIMDCAHVNGSVVCRGGDNAIVVIS